jgi:hypothetical protein
VARLLALAHEIERRIRVGELDDLSHAARVLGLTRGRVTQIVNLTLLAPAIQEAITRGYEMFTERRLRGIVTAPKWRHQRDGWSRLRVKG